MRHKAEVLLAMDVGNTSTACAVFSGQKLAYRRHIPTPANWRAGHLPALLRHDWASRVQAVVVSSVVPRLDGMLGESIKKKLGVTALFLSHRTSAPLTLKIDRPAELGADRIADCLGALAFFSPPLIIIDSGTAITFDLLNEKLEYCGGSILPGIGIAIKSLAENTAKLKDIAFAVPVSPLGANTVDSMRAGIYFGCVGALAHLIALYRQILGPRSRVVATGGLIRHFKDRVPGIDAYEPDLLFYGLKSVHDRYRRLA